MSGGNGFGRNSRQAFAPNQRPAGLLGNPNMMRGGLMGDQNAQNRMNQVVGPNSAFSTAGQASMQPPAAPAPNDAAQQAMQGLQQQSWRTPENWQPPQTKALQNPDSYASGLQRQGFLRGATEQDQKWRMQAQALGVPLHQLQAKLDELRAAGIEPPGGF